MKKSILVNEKKERGRPKREGGVDPLVAARLPRNVVEQVDAWAVKNGHTRSGGVRALIELGLTVKQKLRPRAQNQKDRARELAAKVIDKMADAAATEEDKLVRKRRLLKGPSVFRDVRVDRPNKK